MVGNVFTEQAFQVPFIERDDVIQQFSAAAAHPTLGDAILPGACENLIRSRCSLFKSVFVMQST